ncbi:MAG TPA: serine/threonine-protein kinase, partial [Ktedonobacteraceae bacterium]|nr:serine/threonine-protein kinase [Ktedonobacteraceae bacterium]
MMMQKNLIGQTIGNYRIESLLASGGFGAVYLGRHIIFADRPPVAIKLLHDSLASQLEYDRFVQEALLLEKLKHPYILPLIDAGIERNLPYIITTYASHGSLLDRIRRSAPHPLLLDEALTILSQVGQALHYAHQRGVIHRDLKPVNILFNAQGDALLADFGIAAVSDLARTMVVDATGTPPYMAPEQFSNQASAKSDQYALACVAYELFTTHHPFIVVPESNSLLWMQKHLQEAPLPPRAYNPSLPPHIEQALLKALAKERQDRYPDVAAFIQALQGAAVPLPTTVASPMPPQALSPIPLVSP